MNEFIKERFSYLADNKKETRFFVRFIGCLRLHHFYAPIV